jgi:hypothetical protein
MKVWMHIDQTPVKETKQSQKWREGRRSNRSAEVAGDTLLLLCTSTREIMQEAT